MYHFFFTFKKLNFYSKIRATHGKDQIISLHILSLLAWCMNALKFRKYVSFIIACVDYKEFTISFYVFVFNSRAQFLDFINCLLDSISSIII